MPCHVEQLPNEAKNKIKKTITYPSPVEDDDPLNNHNADVERPSKKQKTSKHN
jgi:hypothetical protein